MKQNLINHYENISQNYCAHHNHKEISAWAGLVLHILFCSFIISGKLELNDEQIKTIVITFFILIESYFVFRYTLNQLILKDHSGSIFGSSKKILNELIQKDEKDNDYKKYYKINVNCNSQFQSSYILPKLLLDKAKELNKKGRKAQDLTKTMILSILVLVSTFSIAYMWIELF